MLLHRINLCLMFLEVIMGYVMSNDYVVVLVATSNNLQMSVYNS
jgi:uncharacterized membrane protein YwzB